MPVPMTPYIQYLDSNGEPRSGGLVYTYAANTTTPKATFTSADGLTQAQNPVVLNSAGMPDHGSGNVGMIWIQGAYDFVVTNADGTDPITVRNETSFNTIAPAGASFFQTWSGDGTTTTFSLSQPLGTDENAVLLFVDNALANFVTNGDFATDTIWTKGTGWAIATGVATATTSSTALSQTANATLVAGQSYTISYTISGFAAGSVIPSIGGTNGTSRNANGTYTETIIAGATQLIAFTGTGFSANIDNVSVRNVQGAGRQVVYPTEFTLNNTSFTLATAPKTGVNNVAMFAFATLVAAASASAAAAEAFANAAGISATSAAGYAAGLYSTSTTSLLIGTGTKIFTTQANKSYAAGMFFSATSAANNTNYMHGNVVSYSGTTLTVNVTDTGGSGTFADWQLGISGTRGATAGASTPIAANSFLANASASSAVPAAFTLGLSQLAGRGASGNLAPITLGAGLTMTGTTLSSSSATTTPWVVYTPTFTALGTATNISVFSRRLGDTLQVKGFFTVGTPTGSEARISLGYNGVDGGLVTDPAKMASIEITGIATRNNVGNEQQFVLGEPSAGYMTFGLQNGSNAGLNKVAGSTAFGTGNNYSFKAEFPITGW